MSTWELVSFWLVALSHLVAETCMDPGIAFGIWNTCGYRFGSPTSALVLCLNPILSHLAISILYYFDPWIHDISGFNSIWYTYSLLDLLKIWFIVCIVSRFIYISLSTQNSQIFCLVHVHFFQLHRWPGSITVIYIFRHPMVFVGTDAMDTDEVERTLYISYITMKFKHHKTSLSMWMSWSMFKLNSFKYNRAPDSPLFIMFKQTKFEPSFSGLNHQYGAHFQEGVRGRILYMR
jgi:hypothetical protein